MADTIDSTGFKNQARALAAELSGATYGDLLTALLWVICRDVRHVAAMRIDVLEGSLGADWVRNPAALADFYADPDHVYGVDVVETRPSRALVTALERGAVSSVGLFPGEIEPRAIAPSVWAAGAICGGEVGRGLIGGCDCAGRVIAGVMVDWNSLQAAFPKPAVRRQLPASEADIDDAIRQLAAQDATLSQGRAEQALCVRWPGQRDLIRARYKALFPDIRRGRPRTKDRTIVQ